MKKTLFLFLIFLFSTIFSFGQLSIDATSTKQGLTSSSTISWNHTVSGSNRLLIVAVACDDKEFASVTYSSQALTYIDDSESTENDQVSLYYLLNPPTGTNSIVVTLTTSDDAFAGAGISFTGVDQTTPLGTSASAIGSTSPATVTTTTTSGDIVVAVTANDDKSMTASVDNDIFTGNQPGFYFGIGTETASSSSTTTEWTLSDDNWAMAAVPVKPAAGSTPGLWTGDVNTDWHTGGNWDDGNVPTSSDNVTIPSSLTNYPIVSSEVAECDDITIENGGSLTISSTYSVTVNGDLNLNGTGTITHSGTGDVILAGTSKNINVSGSEDISDAELQITGSYTLGGTIEILDLNINGGTLSASNNNITINGSWSNSSGTYTPGTNTVTFSSNSTATVSETGFYNLTVNKSSGTLTSSGNVTVSNASIITNGTFTIDGETYTVGETFSLTGGTLKMSSGSIIFDPTDNDDNEAFNVNGGTLDVDGGTLTIGALASDGKIDLDFNSGTIDVSAGTIHISDELDMDGGTLTVSGGTINITAFTGAGGSTTNSSKFTISAGTFNMSGGDINLKKVWSTAKLSIDWASSVTGTVTGGNINSDITTLSHISSQTTNKIWNFTMDGDLTADGNGMWIGNDMTITNGIFVFDLTTSTLDVDGSITMDATADRLDINTGTLDADGALTCNGGVVDFDNGTAVVDGVVTHNSSSSWDFGTATIDFNSDFLLSGSGGINDLSSTNFNLFGDWNNTGTTVITITTGWDLTLDGNSNQEITSNGESFEDVIINNSLNGSTAITTLDVCYVEGNMTFTDGVVSSSNTAYFKLRDDMNIIGTHASDASHVDGYFMLEGDRDASVFYFPVGNGSEYHPLGIQTDNATTAETWLVKYFGSGYGDYTTDTSLSSDQVSTTQYWTLDRSSGVKGAEVLLWSDEESVPDDVEVAHWGGSYWFSENQNISNRTSYNGGYFYWTKTVVNSFSPFTLGGGGGLPIELLSFNAKEVSGKAIIEWSTATEINNDFFVIEKSLDGKHFERVGIVDGMGNSTTKKDYRFVDNFIDQGLTYYRLKQVDYDGVFEYSNISFIKYNNYDIDVLIKQQNKGSVKINIENNQLPIYLNVYNTVGKRIYNKQVVDDNIFLYDLAPGIYIITIELRGSYLETHKFIVK